MPDPGEALRALDRYRDGPAHGRGYPDLHAHVLALARAGLLVIVDEPINKDTEMHPLVRWQFRGGIAEAERKAFLFTQPTDSKGRRYDIAVLVAGLAANRDVYRIGFGKPLEQIGKAWVDAIAAPLAPRVVAQAPCHDIVIAGADLDPPGRGLDNLPVPISTPGFDNAPYLSAGHYITRDPDTGVQNVGNYRGQLKTPRRLGMNPSVELRAGIYAHWLKFKARGEKMPCAVAVGCPPAVSYASVQKMPENLDEIAVAGAIAGAPINVVKAKTVSLLVPAEAEIVIEGLIDTEHLEPEAPFGESHGYVNLQEYNAFMDVTAITRRRDAILTSFISQVAPSESSLIRKVAMEPLFLNHLKSTLGVRGVLRVGMHEPLTSLYAVIAIQFARGTPESEVWRALEGAASLHRFAGKWIVAIDEDIDPDNADAVFWAMSYRCQPQHDLHVLPHKDPGHGPRGPRDRGESAAVLVDATLKGAFAPVALPAPERTPKSGSASARPDVGPVLPLTSSGGDHASELLGGKDQATRTTSDPIAAKVLSRGETLAAPAGRADDFSWPRPGSDATARPEISPEPVAVADTQEKQDTATKNNGKNQADVKKDAKEKSASRVSARVGPHRYYNYYAGRHYGGYRGYHYGWYHR